jgi:hypothetical protein
MGSDEPAIIIDIALAPTQRAWLVRPTSHDSPWLDPMRDKYFDQSTSGARRNTA